MTTEKEIEEALKLLIKEGLIEKIVVNGVEKFRATKKAMKEEKKAEKEDKKEEEETAQASDTADD